MNSFRESFVFFSYCPVDALVLDFLDHNNCNGIFENYNNLQLTCRSPDFIWLLRLSAELFQIRRVMYHNIQKILINKLGLDIPPPPSNSFQSSHGSGSNEIFYSTAT